jgi:hypothetical protein
MEMSSVATAKVSDDRELLNELRQASPNSRINNISLWIDGGKGPIESLADRVRAASQDGKTKLEAIPDLKIVTYLELAGMTVVSGSAEAIAKALELDCVSGATRGDRPIFQGASRQ